MNKLKEVTQLAANSSAYPETKVFWSLVQFFDLPLNECFLIKKCWPLLSLIIMNGEMSNAKDMKQFKGLNASYKNARTQFINLN